MTKTRCKYAVDGLNGQQHWVAEAAGRQAALDKRRRHVRRSIHPNLLRTPLSPGRLNRWRPQLVLRFSPPFLLEESPLSVPRHPLARRARRGKVSDLRATRSVFFCKSRPRQTSSIGRACLQFELVASFSSTSHDGLSSGNRPPSQAPTHLHSRRQRFDK